MNLTLDLWLTTAARIGFETAIVILIAAGVTRLRLPAVQKRAWWLAALVALPFIAMVEVTGALPVKVTRSEQRPVSVPSPAFEVSEKRERIVTVRILDEPLRVTPVDQNIWWPGVIWIAGATLVTGRVLLGMMVVARLRMTSRPIVENVVGETEVLSGRVGLRHSPQVLVNATLKGPLVFGIRKPVLVLPANFSDAFTSGEREAVLMHELAHLLQRDPFWRLVVELVAALFWWNPLVWWARHQFRLCSEDAADAASSQLPSGPEELAACLVKMGNAMSGPQLRGAACFFGVAGRSALRRRVEMLLELAKQHRPAPPLLCRRRAQLAQMIGLVVVGLVPCYALRADAPALGRIVSSILLAQAESRGDLATAPQVQTEPGTETVGVAETNQSTRIYRVDPDLMAVELARIAVAQPRENRENLLLQLNQFWKEKGIIFEAPDSVFYNERTGVLYVRAPLAKQELISMALMILRTGQPQVIYSSYFGDLPDGLWESWSKTHGVPDKNSRLKTLPLTDRRTTNRGTNSQRSSDPFEQARSAIETNALRTDRVSLKPLAVLTKVEAEDLRRTLLQTAGANVLEAPRVSNLVWRQCQVSIQDHMTVVTGLDLTPGPDGEAMAMYSTMPLLTGPVLDILGQDTADGELLLTIGTTVTEFLGYDPLGEVEVPPGRVASPSPMKATLPGPRIRRHEGNATAVIKPDSTVVLGARYPVKKKSADGVIQPETGEMRFTIVLVTASLIDDRGNLISQEAAK